MLNYFVETERIQAQLNEVDALKSHLQEEAEKLQFRLVESEELVRNLQIENNRFVNEFSMKVY